MDVVASNVYNMEEESLGAEMFDGETRSKLVAFSFPTFSLIRKGVVSNHME